MRLQGTELPLEARAHVRAHVRRDRDRVMVAGSALAGSCRFLRFLSPRS